MTWIKLDDGFPDHPKVVAAGWRAAWLYVCGLTYCSRYLTDGRIPKAQVKRLSDIPRADQEANRLVAAGLWVDTGDDYVVHDYTVWQTPSEKIDEARERGKERAKRSYEARKKTAKSSPEEPTKNGRLFAKSSPEESSPEVEVEVEVETSSSSSNSRPPAQPPEEEEDEATKEARRRLAHTPSQINNPTAWIATTATQLRTNGWTPTPTTQLEPTRPYDRQRPECATCDTTGWIDTNSDGTVTQCPDCRQG